MKTKKIGAFLWTLVIISLMSNSGVVDILPSVQAADQPYEYPGGSSGGGGGTPPVATTDAGTTGLPGLSIVGGGSGGAEGIVSLIMSPFVWFGDKVGNILIWLFG